MRLAPLVREVATCLGQDAVLCEILARASTPHLVERILVKPRLLLVALHLNDVFH